MGSGETSPTMVTLHRELVAHLSADPGAAILETPYGFQVNRDDISSRARDYFRRSVGLTTAVVSDAVTETESEEALDGMRDQVRRAAWVFSGPGSPSYALGRWREQGLGQVLADRVRRGHGVTVMASAAACTVGFAALPVYEVYKAGHAPVWLEGLDLLGVLDLPVVVIPHYDNAEGGTHDTRFCYLGETRLASMEGQLPETAAVLGIDEHTALVIDLDAAVARVWGRGVLTIRRRGVSTLVPSGTTLTLDRLRALAAGTDEGGIPAPRQSSAGPDTAARPTGQPVTLQEAVTTAEARFDAARTARDAGAMVDAVLALETVIAAWATDTEEDLGADWARTVLRGMIRQLAGPAQQGLLEPDLTIGLIAGPLLELRRRLRTQGAYDLADVVRDALAAARVHIRDTPDGSRWQFTPGEASRPVTPDGPAPPRA
ncbi:hypothetical protein AB0C61_07025 [Streptomyces sp. NPDC048680]|uniref:hypothetical protein n=1 Tax=Streptomyces sp. NPDC048680 TaxID=3155492 RepID=UPI00344641C0